MAQKRFCRQPPPVIVGGDGDAHLDVLREHAENQHAEGDDDDGNDDGDGDHDCADDPGGAN